MKPELTRVKNDLETMQKALGLSPSMGREWIDWMKRDRWFSLWWCLPGFILIIGAVLSLDRNQQYWGLALHAWEGLFVALVMTLITIVHTRRVKADDGRPEGLIREMKRINGMDAHGKLFWLILLLQILAYMIWFKESHIPFNTSWSGLFVLMGSSCLVAAVAAKAWTLLGWAIPFLAYGLCAPLAGMHSRVGGVLFGLMFIAVALSFSFISVLQIRMLERQAVE